VFKFEFALDCDDIFKRNLLIQENKYFDTVRCNFKIEEIKDCVEDSVSNDERVYSKCMQDDDDDNGDDQDKELSKNSEDYKYFQYLDEEDEFPAAKEQIEKLTNTFSNCVVDIVNSENNCIYPVDTLISSKSKYIGSNSPSSSSKQIVFITPNKNAENIKIDMKHINIKTPVWAEKYLFYANNNNLNKNKLT
jgi:hypothetical protein